VKRRSRGTIPRFSAWNARTLEPRRELQAERVRHLPESSKKACPTEDWGVRANHGAVRIYEAVTPFKVSQGNCLHNSMKNKVI